MTEQHQESSRHLEYLEGGNVLPASWWADLRQEWYKVGPGSKFCLSLFCSVV